MSDDESSYEDDDWTLDPLEMAPDGLEGKIASEPEVVRWVARNIDVRDPDPNDCPDPFAWTLLRQCRDNPKFTLWFTDKLWSKLIPSRSQLDQTVHNMESVSPTEALIERVQAMRAEAEGETEDRTPESGFDSYTEDE